MRLHGTEVKAAKTGQVQLKDAYADVVGNEAWLFNAHISQYSHGNRENHEPVRKRKLLLHRREIDKIVGKVLEKGLTLIPTKMYLKNGMIKCEIAVAKGKKLHDKREAERTQGTERRSAAGHAKRTEAGSLTDMQIRLEQGKPEQFEAAGPGDHRLMRMAGSTFDHPLDPGVAGQRRVRRQTGTIPRVAQGVRASRRSAWRSPAAERARNSRLRSCASSSATTVRALRSKAVRDFAFALDPALATPEYVAAAAEGAFTGDYEPDQLKTDPKKADARAASVTLLVTSGIPPSNARCERGRILGEAQNFTRDLVNEPANLLTPTSLADVRAGDGRGSTASAARSSTGSR